jgi:hypothetical protein
MKLEDSIREGFEPIRASGRLAAVRSAGRRRRAARMAAGITSVVTVALVLAFVVPSFLPNGARSTAAAQTLRSLSRTASAQPLVSMESDEFLYSRLVARWESCDGNSCKWERNVREMWVALDGSGRIAGTRGPMTFSERLGPGHLGVDRDGEVPTDVDALRAYVDDRASHADQPLRYEMFVVIADLLRESFSSPVLSPALRSSLFEIAATLPGVESLGEVADEHGRPGIGIAFTHDGVRLELIFDSDTSAILGEREVNIANEQTIPGSWIVYLESGTVDSTNERP